MSLAERTRNADGWLLEYRMYHGTGSRLECEGSYSAVQMGPIISQSMTPAERDAICNDGQWHHTSRACAGVEYRLWNHLRPAEPVGQLSLFGAS